MRFVAAIVSFVIAFGLIAFGIAQRTVFAAPDNVTASVALTTDATVTVIDSKTLKSLDGRQDVNISGSDKIFAAYGRSEDVIGWVGKASYNKIGYSAAKTALTNTLVKGSQTEVPNPKGSDLWLQEYSRGSDLNITLNVPDDISILVVSDGKKAAPSDVSIRWPLDNRTPWSGPLIVGGFLFLLIGIALYLWAFIHLRRSRGPRRKSPAKMPKVPRQRRYKVRKPKAVTSAPAGRRSRRRMIAVVPVLLVSTLALSGCSAELWPEFMTGSSASPSPTATASKVPAAAGAEPPAVTAPQLKEILARISAVAAKADAAIDPELAKTRFTGAALELRTANYAIRKVDSTYAPVAPIPTEKIEVSLPQATAKWPRTVFTVLTTPSDKTVPPLALYLVQETPRDDYKVAYATALEASTVTPRMAPANVGATKLPPDNPFLVMAPSALALSYGDILEKGADSPHSKEFDTSKDALIGLIGLEVRKKLQANPKATLTFANTVGTGETLSLGSVDSGAIVATYLNETITAKPLEAGSAVNPEGAVKSLSGLTGTTKGTTAVYGDQLLFYVPPISSKGNKKVVLLGFATGLISAKELP
ncbi:hypothetical protein [Glaciihabitans sp. UYNi722]|uniref:hypothetical protein n=1 Tax=Glaciihabitans sp. UYNi722 TaxID=3156344 RepID=UPI003398B7AB